MSDADDYREQGTFTVIVNEEEYCIPRYCPHRGGRLDYGDINAQRKTISCPLHRSVFDLETGEQLSGPPCARLAVSKRSRETLE